MLEGVLRQARVLEELVKARLEVDVAGLVAGMRARLEARLALKPIPVAADLADAKGPMGWGRVRTTAWEAERFRKIVLSHVTMRPMIEGLAVVVLPAPRLDAPVFACDLMALPTRVSVNADVYGDKQLTRDLLAPLGESFVRLGAGAGPAWAEPISSGVGLHAKVSPRSVDDAFGALTSALARYFDVVQSAAASDQIDSLGANAQRDFFRAFHEHGPRRGALGRLFGERWAERYSRLIFE
jgi:hypothetical protein